MKSIYIMSLTYLFTDAEGAIEGFEGTEVDVFTTEGDADEWRRERQNVMCEANLVEGNRKRCMRSRFEHKSIDEDDLVEFEREFEFECEVKLTYYKTFTVTAENEQEAEDLAYAEAEDYDFSCEINDDFDCTVENVEKA